MRLVAFRKRLIFLYYGENNGKKLPQYGRMGAPVIVAV